MKTYKTCIALLLAGSVSLPVWALNVDMTPGLWEHRFTVTNSNDEVAQAMQQMQEQLAKMSAEERKMMGSMMESYGIGVSADGTTVKACITQEEIDRGQLPQQDDNCTQEVTEHGKNVYKMKFTCTGDMTYSGTGEVAFKDSKNYTGTSTFTNQVNGKTETTVIEQRGKWLSADCGKLKPAGNIQ